MARDGVTTRRHVKEMGTQGSYDTVEAWGSQVMRCMYSDVCGIDAHQHAPGQAPGPSSCASRARRVGAVPMTVSVWVAMVRRIRDG